MSSNILALGTWNLRSIPAWAGKPYRVTGYRQRRTRGLSPRGRGNPRRHEHRQDYPGSIPAWAGKPPRRRCSRGSLRVYPRVGGETSKVRRPGQISLSWVYPRVGGETNERVDHPPLRPPPVYPRVGGETLLNRQRVRSTVALGLSPRGRGNPRPGPVSTSRRRSIPAAGIPTAAQRDSQDDMVYPRVGGETRGKARWSACGTICGLSPRGRGNRDEVGK